MKRHERRGNVVPMSETKAADNELEAFLTPVAEGERSPEHDARVKAQVEATLAKKEKAGADSYRSLDEMMARFGCVAR